MDNNLDNNQGGRRPDKGDPRRDQDPNRNKKNHQSILAFLICLLVTLVCFSLFTNMLQDNSSEITYDKFIDMVNNDEVKSVTLQSDNLTIVPKKQVNPYQEISYYTNLTEDETALTKRLEGTGIIFKSEPPDAFGEFMAMMLSVLLPSVLLFVLLMFFMRRMNKGGGGMMGVGKSRAKAYVAGKRPESHLRMLPDRMKPRNPCRRLWNFFTIQANTWKLVLNCRRAPCL